MRGFRPLLTIIAAGLATTARAQPASSSFYRAAPEADHDRDTRVELPKGKLSRLSRAERGYVSGLLEPAQAAVRTHLSNPRSARFTDLRVGAQGDVAVLCGVVSAEGADGVRAEERFIARPRVATLESEVGAGRLAEAETAVGCRG